MVIFALDERRYALALSSVERVVRVVDIIPLPGTPEVVLGVINVRGDIVPVYDLRKRFRLPSRELDLSDQLLIARTSKRRVALVVDSVSGVLELRGREITAADKILPGMEYVRGVVKLQNDLVIIHDLDQFLSPEEETTLDETLKTLPEADDQMMKDG